ncbi:MAG: rhodanese-like domain-containing protein [Dehalococcoidia bacterium]|nr:rhodanese-like domain-containing protein [Dehalococcoidia bacterium]
MGAQILQDMGFDNVTYMDGGMTAWKEAGLPTKE